MAYSVVVSLKQTLERFLSPCQLPRILLPNSEVQLIYEDLCYLKSFFDKISSLHGSSRVDGLEKQIKDVIQKTQDLIESHMSDRFHSASEGSEDKSSISGLSQELLKVKQQLGSVMELLKTKGEYEEDEQEQQLQPPPSSPFPAGIDSGGKNKMVGLHDELMKLKQRLLRESRSKFVAVVGMAGIGKTTLAKKVLYDPIVLNIFSVRIFVTIGHEYQLKELLLLALHQVGFHIEEMKQKKEKELGEYLYKSLENKRYAVVLDDIWDALAWNELEHFFPDDNDESRIILTTRMPDVIHRAGINENSLQIRFLSDDESWDLLHEMVFSNGAESCPPELVEIGRKIAKNCEGLPLAIVEVGKLLCKTGKTTESWEEIAGNVDSAIRLTDEDTLISKSLSSSYKRLPQHLKACFLYMGVFPTDYKIPTSELIKLWVAEGFIEPALDENLEDKAEKYLDELVSRSVVLVHERSSRGGIKTCWIHSVFRNLCASEARNEKFFHAINDCSGIFPQGTNKQRRLCSQNNVVLGFKQVRSSMETCATARSVLCFGPQHQHPMRVYLGFRFLRVLHALRIGFCKFPDEVLKLVQLRYLALTYDGVIPSSISRLCNLEVLIINPNQRIHSSKIPRYLPLEIWELHELRHLQCLGYDLPDPSTAAETGVLEKLLTLAGVSAYSYTYGVLVRMPNLTKLGIWFEPTHPAADYFNLFVALFKLQSFKFVVMNLGIGSQALSSPMAFPPGLRKLSLSGCRLPWEDMGAVAALPNLEVLKLRSYSFRGPTWVVGEGAFPQLKFLLLEDLDVKEWIADDTIFPLLRSLIVRRCCYLESIPYAMGGIPTLEMIELADCSKLVVQSARKIQEKQQEDFGNDLLQLRLPS